MKRAKASSDVYQRARQIAAAKAIQSGRIDVPLRCAHCDSASIRPDRVERNDVGEMMLECLNCGRLTDPVSARSGRKARIKATILKGIDIHNLKGTS